MGSQTPLRLPLIDFSNLNEYTNSLVWDATKTQVRQALEDFGCFEATFGNISPELQVAMFDSLPQLFDFPLETKLTNTSPKPFHGYDGQNPTEPLFESMGIDDVIMLEKVESFAKLWWPEGNPDFCKTVQEFSEKLSKMDQMVRMMVLESLGLEKYMDEHMDSTDYLLRLNKYRVPETNESNLGLNSHTDTNMLSILKQNEVGGLEVQTKSGNWIEVHFSVPNSFLVMNGDSFYAWTNGRLHSPSHRVVMSGNKVRYSLGFFSVPKPGYLVKAPKETVDEEHPLLFKPFDHVEFLEFLEFYNTEAGLNTQTPLKTYCGV